MCERGFRQNHDFFQLFVQNLLYKIFFMKLNVTHIQELMKKECNNKTEALLNLKYCMSRVIQILLGPWQFSENYAPKKNKKIIANDISNELLLKNVNEGKNFNPMKHCE